MCGLVALLAFPGESFSKSDLSVATELLYHRGPDSSGLRVWPRSSEAAIRLGLGHTRLSILDLSHSADQPMQSADGDVTLVYNGEIYNYVELRDELVRLGYPFVSSGDTEVVLAAYLTWGRACFSRFVGMFALVIVDERSQQVVAARDPFGIKPLFTTLTDRGRVFASELRSVRAVAGTSPVAHAENVLRHLRLGLAARRGQTIYRDIDAVLPGHVMTVDLTSGSSGTSAFYELGVQTLTVNDISFDEAADHLRELFMRSVGLHMRSDVLVGSALSGGIDSSAILATAALTLGEGRSLNAFTFAATGIALDETGWATLAAQAAQARHHVIRPTPQELLDDLKLLTRGWDWPLAGTSVYAQYRVFRAAHQMGVKVMLDGQGADELLGGYDYYVAARVASLLRQGHPGRARSLLMRARARGLRPFQTAQQVADCLLPARAQSAFRLAVGRPLMPPWVDEAWFLRHHAQLQPVHATRATEVLRHELVGDLTENLVPHLLRYEDTNSMLWSVESRVPFLIPEMAEFCLALPEEYLIDGDGVSKAVFRRAMRGVVPAAIVERTDKVGFQPPHDLWLRAMTDHQRQVLLKSTTSRLPFLRPAEFEKLWGSASSNERASEYVWRTIFLAEWAEQHEVEFA